jgi:hypothetical protein
MQNNNPTGIHVYILDKKDQRIGVLAATNNDIDPDNVFIGWSLCKLSAGDKFDAERGVEIAYERSRKCSVAPIPMSIVPRYEAFKHRCNKYFKNKTVIC